MGRSALLRVYVPAEDASDAWLLLPEAPRRSTVTWRNGEFGLLTESMQEDVVIAHHDGTRYLCPRMPRLRMLEGVVAFHHGFGDLEASLIVPESAAILAAAELEAIRERDDRARSHILTSPFHVPLRWFLMFDPSERTLEVDEDGMQLRYRTRRREATRRLRRAIRALRTAGMDATTEEMEQLLDWLLEFPGDRLVELDYDTVAGLFDPDALADDHSCNDLWSAVQGLEEGDLDAARRWYEVVASRWAEPMLMAYAN